MVNLLQKSSLILLNNLFFLSLVSSIFHFPLNYLLLDFQAGRIDLFDLAGTHLDMHPYLVVSITISNIDKWKVMTTVSSVPKDPDVGRQHSWLLLYLLYCVRTYVLPAWFNTWTYGSVHPVLVICTRYSISGRIYYGNVCVRDSIHDCTFSKNGRAQASVHVNTISRNYHTISRKVCAHAYLSILARTYMCLFVCSSDSVSICARASASISAHSVFSECLSVVTFNKLLWGDLVNGSRTRSW